VPDSLRFLVAVGILAGLVYGAGWALSSFPPEPQPTVKALASEKLRQH
jgi:hypothetical protein